MKEGSHAAHLYLIWSSRCSPCVPPLLKLVDFYLLGLDSALPSDSLPSQ